MAYNKDLRAKVPEATYRQVEAICNERGIHLSDFIREAVDRHLGISDKLEEQDSEIKSLEETVAEKEALIESMNGRMKEGQRISERLQAIIRIHKTRSWWQRLRNKQITGDDVDENIIETEMKREKAIYGEKT